MFVSFYSFEIFDSSVDWLNLIISSFFEYNMTSRLFHDSKFNDLEEYEWTRWKYNASVFRVDFPGKYWNINV